MNPAPLYGFGGMEWIWVILIIVVLLFGAKKLPELAKSIGKATGEFQKGRTEIEREIKEAKASIEEANDDIKEGISIDVPVEDPARTKLVKAAKELGVVTAGKSDEELRDEVKKALAKSSD